VSIFDKLLPIFNRKSTEDLGAIITSIDNKTTELNANVSAMQNEILITKADSVWLDEWGNRFGVYRQTGEQDDPYRTRILKSVTKDRNSSKAYELLTKEILGEDTCVIPYETYHDVFTLSGSALSGPQKFEDGENYTEGVMHIKVDKPITQELLDEIEKIRSGGINVVFIYIGDIVIDMTSIDEIYS
jgi:hypothetical protein